MPLQSASISVLLQGLFSSTYAGVPYSLSPNINKTVVFGIGGEEGQVNKIGSVDFPAATNLIIDLGSSQVKNYLNTAQSAGLTTVKAIFIYNNHAVSDLLISSDTPNAWVEFLQTGSTALIGPGNFLLACSTTDGAWPITAITGCNISLTQSDGNLNGYMWLLGE